jgi:hypothetical protein
MLVRSVIVLVLLAVTACGVAYAVEQRRNAPPQPAPSVLFAK